MISGDTIFALSTARGMAGVAVIRMSGSRALEAAGAIGGKLPEPHRAVVKIFRHPTTRIAIDQGLLLCFPGPTSFTGEDCAEFHVHGSPVVVEAIFEALSLFARPADAGEFTHRAFRNGKLDLVAAEGLSDLLEARTERQRRQALQHALGHPSKVFDAWRAEIVWLLSRVEAAVDFGDEDDVAQSALAGVLDRCATLCADLRRAVDEGRRGRTIRDGVTVVLVGAPNVGKSSLMNALARKDVAIVSSKPGTTRDVVGAEIVLAGVPVALRDTAGLRDQASDEIEVEGIRRSKLEMDQAHLRVWISSPDVSGSEPPQEIIDSGVIWVENKCDLPLSQSIRYRNDILVEPHYRISAKNLIGMEALLSGLDQAVGTLVGAAEAPAIVRSRHYNGVVHALAHLEAAMEMQEGPLEVMAEELRAAMFEIGRITGQVNVEDLLDSIFKSFCIGK